MHSSVGGGIRKRHVIVLKRLRDDVFCRSDKEEYANFAALQKRQRVCDSATSSLPRMICAKILRKSYVAQPQPVDLINANFAALQAAASEVTEHALALAQGYCALCTRTRLVEFSIPC